MKACKCETTIPDKDKKGVEFVYIDRRGNYLWDFNEQINPNWIDTCDNNILLKEGLWTIQRMYYFIHDSWVVALGQISYDNQEDALKDIDSEDFIISQELKDAYYHTAIVVQQGSQYIQDSNIVRMVHNIENMRLDLLRSCE